jgi:hypothetical protein
MSEQLLDRCLPKAMHAGEDGKSFLLIDSTSSDEFRYSSRVLDAATNVLAQLTNDFGLKPTPCLTRGMMLQFTA